MSGVRPAPPGRRTERVHDGTGTQRRTRSLRRFVRGARVPVLLIVLALVAVWMIGGVFAGRRASSIDARLRAAVQDGRALAVERAAVADRRASDLAASRAVQEAFTARDVRALRALRGTDANVVFVLGRQPVAGRMREPAIRSLIPLFGNGRRLGSVVVQTPLDLAFLSDVQRSSRAASDVLLVIVSNARVTAGAQAGVPLDVPGDRGVVDFDGRRYRAAATTVTAGADATRLVALSRDPTNSVGPTGLAEAALLALATLVAAASLLARRFPTPRVLGERRRHMPPESLTTVDSAIALVGGALAATHNPSALLSVILSGAIEATGAAGGQLLEDGRVLAEYGIRRPDGETLAADVGEPTGEHVHIVVWPRARSFSPEAREALSWFAEQASVALQNAHLHHLVQRQAVSDELTGLANRRGFMAALATEASRANRSGTPLVLVLADIDDFKQVNDRYGHNVGDVVLAGFARIVRESVRDIDLPARLGGEEFAVLLPDTDVAGGVQLAERLRLTFAASRLSGNGNDVQVTASFGVAAYAAGADIDQFLIDADACLYRAKAQGKNAVVSTTMDVQ